MGVCEEILASLYQTSLAQLENLVEAKDDGEKIFLQAGRTLDSIVNVLVLAISSVGAKFLAEAEGRSGEKHEKGGQASRLCRTREEGKQARPEES